ncbi:MAG TPA: hypothetical protein VGF17_04140, partial [Phytomonospora sp.]
AVREKQLSSRFRLFAATGACVLALGLSACGSDDGGGGDRSTADPRTSAPAQDEELPADVALFEGTWVAEGKTLTCDGAGSCTYTEEDGGVYTGTMAPLAEGVFALEMTVEGGGRMLSLTVSPTPNGGGIEVRAGEGEIVLYEKQA